MGCDEITAECISHVDGEFVDRYEYWADPPDEPSPRFAAWLRRTLDGHCGRTGGGYDEDAEHMGVYLWESLGPLSIAESGYFPHQTDDLPAIRAWLNRHGFTTDWLDKPHVSRHVGVVVPMPDGTIHVLREP